jgi:hypothetical protein
LALPANCRFYELSRLHPARFWAFYFFLEYPTNKISAGFSDVWLHGKNLRLSILHGAVDPRLSFLQAEQSDIR